MANSKSKVFTPSSASFKDLLLVPLISACIIATATHEIKTAGVLLVLTLLRLIYSYGSSHKKKQQPTEKTRILGPTLTYITMQMTLLAALSCGLIYGAAIHWRIPSQQAGILLVGAICSLLPLELPIEVEVLLRQAASKLAQSHMQAKKASAIATLGATTTIFVDMGSGNDLEPSSTLYKQVSNAVEAARRARLKVCLMVDSNAKAAKDAAQRFYAIKRPKDVVVVSGSELQKLDDMQLLKLIEDGNITFYHLSSEDRVRIVNVTKKRGSIVTFLGSSNNDTSAFEQANVAIAALSDESGAFTQAADIVGQDTNFVTLVHAVQQGRLALSGARKAILTSLTAHSGELATIFISLCAIGLYHIPVALTGIEILAINLLAGLFPTLAFGKDRPDGELLAKPFPKHTVRGITAHELRDLLWCGMLISGLAFLNYLWFFKRNNITASYLTSGSPIHMQATTLTFLTIVSCQLVTILQRRTGNGMLRLHQLHNRMFWLGLLATVLSVGIILYTPVSSIFGTRALTAADWLCAIGAATLFGIIREFQRYTAKHHRQAVLELHRAVHSKVTT